MDALQRISDASKDEVRDEVENTFATYAIVNEMKRKFPEFPEDYLKNKVENAVKLGGYTTAAINYGYNVYENHQEFKSFHNALQADAWDTLPISGALLNSGIMAIYGMGVSTERQVLLGVGTGVAINVIVDKKKIELKAEEETQEEESAE